jgi:hypothetical protein
VVKQQNQLLFINPKNSRREVSCLYWLFGVIMRHCVGVVSFEILGLMVMSGCVAKLSQSRVGGSLVVKLGSRVITEFVLRTFHHSEPGVWGLRGGRSLLELLRRATFGRTSHHLEFGVFSSAGG